MAWFIVEKNSAIVASFMMFTGESATSQVTTAIPSLSILFYMFINHNLKDSGFKYVQWLLFPFPTNT
jgi:hypothetical protein